MANQISGRVIRVGVTQNIPTKSGVSFVKRELVIDATPFDRYTGERSKFENFPSIQFTGERAKLLDNVAVGQVVTVDFGLNGRPYQRDNGVVDYFTDVVGFRVAVKAEQQPQAAPAPAPEPQRDPFDFPPSNTPYQI